MILGTHVIFGTYGFWLPNDPRGSWSKFVGSWELRQFGPATKVNTRQSLAKRGHDRAMRLRAKRALQHPPVHLTGRQAQSVARGFKLAIGEGEYHVLACAILPEHVHLVIGPAKLTPRRLAAHLKTRSVQQLVADHLWPDPDTQVWSRGCWAVFLTEPAMLRSATSYVEQNPLKEGKRMQRWSFVTPVD